MSVKPSDVRSYLKDYGIDSTCADRWIENRIARRVIPMIEARTGLSLSGEKEVVEYHDGTGEPVLNLDTVNALELVRIDIIDYRDFNLTIQYELNKEEGFIRAKFAREYVSFPVFPRGRKNVKVTLKVGYEADDIPEDIQEAIVYLTAYDVLGYEAGIDGGGGSLSVVSWSRSFGARGKYTEIRADLWNNAHEIIRRYSSQVVGQ